MTPMKSSDPMKACIQLCWDCRNTCQDTLFNHCLSMGGVHAAQAHVRLMTDCIQICQAAADFMVRGSALHTEVCRACAAICRACADSCARIGDAHMQACADRCRKCAESCEAMARMPETA